MDPLRCNLPDPSSQWCSHIEDPQHSDPLDYTLGYQGNQSAFAWYYQWNTTGVSDATLAEIYGYLETFAHYQDTEAIQNVIFAFVGLDLETLLIRIVCQNNLETVKYLVNTFDLPSEIALQKAHHCAAPEIIAYLEDPFPENKVPHSWNH